MKIVSHRGYTKGFVENSKNAIQAASNLGCQFIKLDVILSNNETLFLSHDLYSHRGVYLESCSDIDLIETHQLNKLKDVLIKFQHITFQLDIKSKKSNIINNLVKLIYIDNQYQNCILSSFNEKHLDDIIKLESKFNIDIKKGYITNNTHSDNFSNIIKKYNLYLIIIEHSQLNTELVNDIHKLNAKISVYTVNDRYMIKICKKMSVDYVVTDYPKSFLPKLNLNLKLFNNQRMN